MAEALLRAHGGANFQSFSAGSQPNGRVNPYALSQIRAAGWPTDDYHSKSWDAFAAPAAPQLDFIFTVCGNAAGEACPIWPGRPASAHWGLADPAAVVGSAAAIEAAFSNSFLILQRRIQRFVSLPLGTLDADALQTQLRAIGEIS